ncbi:transposase IS3/IS911 family protein [Azoarcus sp. CIB]|nr:transposase IS3/IS911 family protein [Azoarcus sp. CIB]
MEDRVHERSIADTMNLVISRRGRRTNSEAFKQSVISACREPGVSVAGIALASGVNANQVHRWMRERDIAPPRRHTPAAVEIAGRVECKAQIKPTRVRKTRRDSMVITTISSTELDFQSNSNCRSARSCSPRGPLLRRGSRRHLRVGQSRDSQ